MKNTAFISFVIVFTAGVIGILLFPYHTINPGVMIEDHMRLKNDCLSCHTPGAGVQTEKCIACHQLSEIGIKLVDGTEKNILNNRSNLLHQSIINIKCYDCHTEHNGLSRENATLTFRHDVLELDLQKECSNCHLPQKPEDVLHRSLGKAIQCVDCHTTDRWKPSTFDHKKYFRFDRNHPSNCSNCHDVNKTFTTYTCYNCHEHSPDRIAQKHIKEGIRNFGNCVECHRSGDEKETEGRGNKKHGRDRDDN